MTAEELRKMSEMTFDEVNDDDIPKLGSFRYDMDMLPAERVERLLASGKNPYFRKTCSGSKIKISFADNGRSFEDNMVNLLSSQ